MAKLKPNKKRKDFQCPPSPNINKDKIVKEVREDLLKRSERGIKKYGVTLDRTDLSHLEWMNHHYEELLDAALYVKKQINIMKSKRILSFIDFIKKKFPDGTTPNDKESAILYNHYVNNMKNKL